MCGVVGYVGKQAHCSQILLNSLSYLEYRGYDSAGLAILNNTTLSVVKRKGKLNALAEAVKLTPIEGNVGIGHTRWATHGEPSDINSHPHYNASKTLAVVHNGIIENYLELKQQLIKEGYVFISATDTEVVAHLLDKYMLKYNNLLQALQHVVGLLKGSYALAAISTNSKIIVATSKDSPLMVGVLKDGFMVASDTLAMLDYTNTFFKLDNYDCVELGLDFCNFYNKEGKAINKVSFGSLETPKSLSKDGYEHFMLKEIFEQPQKIIDTLKANYTDGVLFANITLPKNITNIYFIACGTSYYASLVGANIISKLSKINTYCMIASEFKTSNINLLPTDLVVFVSQSGETADTIMAIKYIAEHFKCHTLAILNVLGSSISHLVDNVIYTKAMAEIAVASTKAYTTQLLVLIMLACKISNINFVEYEALIKKLTNDMKVLLSDNLQSKLTDMVAYIAQYNSVFFLGRGLDYFTALEGALKLKEISYIHAESFPAGELKHGSIALITKGTPVIVVITQEDLASKSISNISEVKSRGARVICISNANWVEKYNLKELCDEIIELPPSKDELMPLISVVVLQMLAYSTAVYLGNDVDKPRNLAKSVTVE